MGKRLAAGAKIPAFYYDTPYEPQKSFYELLAKDGPVMMVFLRNFGHPLTRHYIMEYLESFPALRSGRLVCVVRTQPQTISHAIPKGAIPFEVMCDPEGVLYDFFDIPESASKLKSYSLEALRILKEAQKEGYVPGKKELQQLPLTLVVGREGQVLFAHYGRSVTDLPADCSAMQQVLEKLDLPARDDWQEGPEQPDRVLPQAEEMTGFAPAGEEELDEEELMALLTGEPLAAEPRQAAPQPESAPKAPAAAPASPVPPVQQPQPPAAPRPPADIRMGKMIYPEGHVARAVDFSALGFDDGEN